MRRDAVGGVVDWVDQVVADLPEITLQEIDTRPAPHAVPITGWRRLTGLTASILGGCVLFLALIWLGWRVVVAADRVLDDWSGPGPVTQSDQPTEEPAPPVPVAATASVVWSWHGVEEGLPAGGVVDVAIGPDGSIWTVVDAATQVHVARGVRDVWTTYDIGLEELTGRPIWLAVAGDDSVWMALEAEDGSEQLVGFDGESWAPADGIQLWGSVVARGDAGQLWVAGVDDQMRLIRLEWADDRWAVARAAPGVSFGGVTSMSEVEPALLDMRVAMGVDGIAWFAADGLIVRFDGNVVTTSETVDDTWIAMDPDGGVWIPTDHGLRRYLDPSWSYYDARHGLPGTPPVRGAIRFGTDHTWALFDSGSSSHGYRFDGSVWLPTSDVPPGSGLALTAARSPRVAYTPVGSGSSLPNDAAWLRVGREWVQLADGDGASLGSLNRACRDPRGMIWIAVAGRLGSVRLSDV